MYVSLRYVPLGRIQSVMWGRCHIIRCGHTRATPYMRALFKSSRRIFHTGKANIIIHNNRWRFERRVVSRSIRSREVGCRGGTSLSDCAFAQSPRTSCVICSDNPMRVVCVGMFMRPCVRECVRRMLGNVLSERLVLPHQPTNGMAIDSRRRWRRRRQRRPRLWSYWSPYRSFRAILSVLCGLTTHSVYGVHSSRWCYAIVPNNRMGKYWSRTLPVEASGASRLNEL